MGQSNVRSIALYAHPYPLPKLKAAYYRKEVRSFFNAWVKGWTYAEGGVEGPMMGVDGHLGEMTFEDLIELFYYRIEGSI